MVGLGRWVTIQWNVVIHRTASVPKIQNRSTSGFRNGCASPRWGLQQLQQKGYLCTWRIWNHYVSFPFVSLSRNQSTGINHVIMYHSLTWIQTLWCNMLSHSTRLLTSHCVFLKQGQKPFDVVDRLRHSRSLVSPMSARLKFTYNSSVTVRATRKRKIAASVLHVVNSVWCGGTPIWVILKTEQQISKGIYIKICMQWRMQDFSKGVFVGGGCQSREVGSQLLMRLHVKKFVSKWKNRHPWM